MTMTTVDPSVSRNPIARDATDLPTICVLCSHNCGVRVDVADGEIVAVRGDETSPITAGYICNKAVSIPQYVRHGQRVEYPLRRRPDGLFDRVDWDTAIAEIAAKLNDIRARHSPRAIGLVGVGGQGNHMDAPYALGWLRMLGSKRWFNAFAQEKTQHCLLDQWMFDASPATYLHADQKNARFLLVLGTNPRISNRGHNATEYFQALGADPTRTLVVEKTRDFETLRAALAAVDVAEMARRCGIETQDLVETATELATAESAAILYDLGVEQTPFSTLIAYLIRVLLVLTDNVGRPGGNVFFETLLPPVHEPDRKRDLERALASGISAIAALGNFGMFSPTLVPEEILLDHPERLRALVVEGSNPLLSYSDTSRWREARAHLDLLVVIEPAMTETAALADWVLPAPVGYEKWEMANFPKGYPQIQVQIRPPVVAGPPEALPEPEIYTRLAEAMGLVEPVPAELHALAAGALEPEGAMRFLGAAQTFAGGEPRTAKERLLFAAYRALGPHLDGPGLAAIWVLCQLNAMQRFASVIRTLGPEWQARGPLEVGAELYRRLMAHPEGVEIARLSEETNLEDHLGFEDGRIRLAPEPMLGELARAIATVPADDAAYPFVLAAGLRTRWTANTIHRDPAWRKGRGPHCALNLAPADASALGVKAGEPVRVATARGALVLPAQIDAKLQPGHAWMPNGFGMEYRHEDGTVTVDGGNQNELTDVADRDPFTGIPHHRYVRCRIEPVRAAAATP